MINFINITNYVNQYSVVHDGHNYVGCDGQNYSESGEKNYGHLAF